MEFLTEEEEDVLLEPVFRYQPIHKAHRMLTYRLGRIPTMSEWLAEVNITREELEEAQAACQKCLDHIVEEHKGYIVHTAKQFKSYSWQKEELILSGEEGLRFALMDYARQPGHRFIRYSTRHIKAEIGKHVTRMMEKKLPEWLLRIKQKYAAVLCT